MISRRRMVNRMLAGAGLLTLGSCDEAVDQKRYSAADTRQLALQRQQEEETRGQSRFGEQRYLGYRGLSSLPWFDLDDAGQLLCTDDSVPTIIDVHAHLGMSFLFKPKLDLLQRTERVRHLLDCDAPDAPCDLDLDVYINGNFDNAALKTLSRTTLTQGLWGNEFARSHSVPNLLREMDAMRVHKSFVLPIKLGLPFGDDLTQQWQRAVTSAEGRLIAGVSVHPEDSNAVQQLQTYAAAGARIVKLHPTVQQFYPDSRALWPIYDAADRLGMVIFFHGGRAGIEPEDRLRFAMPRHYEAVLREFPSLQVVLGHAGARDGKAMLEIALRYENAWLGIHGQSISRLDEIIERTAGKRLLFGSDWPWYHIGATLAKVLICTQSPKRHSLRHALLQGNALELFSDLLSS